MEDIKILIVDDNPSIHEDIRDMLAHNDLTASLTVDTLSMELFDAPLYSKSQKKHPYEYHIDSVYLGRDAISKVQNALDEESPYAIIFMDVRIPPGIDGIQAAVEILKIDPKTEIVVISAFSDYSVNEFSQELGVRDNLLFMRKPFDILEITQVTLALATKWLQRKTLEKNDELLAHELETQYQALKRIASGDRSARAPENSQNKYIRELGKLINKQANVLTETLQQVEEDNKILVESVSHHLDVLNAVSAGKLDVKVNEHSQNDEIQRLSKAINSTIDALRLNTEFLEERIKERTGELEKSNAELRQAQINLINAEKLAAVGQLASGIAHEINTPIGFIRSNFTTLQKYVKKIQEVLHVIEESSTEQHVILKMIDRMKIPFILSDLNNILTQNYEGLSTVSSIVKDLKTFSMVDQCKDYGDIDINRALENTLSIARNDILKEIVVQMRLESQSLVHGNAGELNQVLLSVFMNSAYAMKDAKESPLLTIHTWEDQQTIHCNISDNGCGIDDTILEKVFDPFFTTKSVGEGTGLGLSMSHEIITKHHKGTMTLESTVNHGTTVHITLPINKGEHR